MKIWIISSNNAFHWQTRDRRTESVVAVSVKVKIHCALIQGFKFLIFFIWYQNRLGCEFGSYTYSFLWVNNICAQFNLKFGIESSLIETFVVRKGYLVLVNIKMLMKTWTILDVPIKLCIHIEHVCNQRVDRNCSKTHNINAVALWHA